MISGTVPAPIQTSRSAGHSSGSTCRSGASTSEKRLLPSGSRPGGAIVKRSDSVSP